MDGRSELDIFQRTMSGLRRMCGQASVLIFSLLFGLSAIGADALTGAGGADPWLDEGVDEFLPVDRAFVFSTESQDGVLVARWEMPDGYYLYKHRFNFQVRDGSDVRLGEAEIPAGKAKFDEFFGDVEVFYHSAEARVPVSGNGIVEVGVGYQGCADAGLCYPPETQWVAVDVGTGAASGSGDGGAIASADAGMNGGRLANAEEDEAAVASVLSGAADTTEEQSLAGLLTESGLLTSIAIFFLAGVGLAFTPCVLPMVPILSSIIVGESDGLSRARAFSLSFAYVIGMAVTYAILGVLMGVFGASLNLQAALQSPAVLTVFAIIFVALSFSMFGFYELRLPSGLQNRLNAMSEKQGGGKHLSVAVMGSLSSLVVSPCVSAPLAGALIYISATGDGLMGGAALLALGLGMGAPLLLIGASGGHLLPRAGVWMNAVKAVFGVLLLGVAVWLLERVVPASVTLFLWAALAIGVGVYLGALDFSPREGWSQLWKASGALSLVYGVLLLIGAASGAHNPLQPLESFAGTHQRSSLDGSAQSGRLVWHEANDLGALEVSIAAAKADGRPVLLDLYADWCISCKVMERNVFPQPRVSDRLAQFYLVRADVTENSAAHQALLNQYGLFGPPSFVFFGEDGYQLGDHTVQGEIGAEALVAHLDRVLRVSGIEGAKQVALNNR